MTALGARHGMSRQGRYDFWTRPTVSGRGPKARPSTITFFHFGFHLLKFQKIDQTSKIRIHLYKTWKNMK
jgi:hypothetical protein